MTHYIDKDALVAEINKLVNQDFSVIDNLSGRTAYFQAVGDFYRIIGTIEVKEDIGHYELEEFARIIRGNLTGINKTVQTLFEAKYQQLTGNKMYGGYKD